MAKAIDLTGMKFNRLTVIERVDKTDKSGCAYWKCRCDSGNITVVRATRLKSGNTQSCGCLGKEFRNKHGMTDAKIYNTWEGIKVRCFNQHCKAYKHYGGRGITLCDEWVHDFKAFYEYVSTLPHFGEKDCSLDRIDNNGNYEPGNLRFVTHKTQCRNRRSNIVVEYEGKQMTLTEASELSGINYPTLLHRFHQGDRGERLFRPLKRR